MVCCYEGNRVVVPPQGHEAVLIELHTCHPGVAHMKTLARMFLWWPHLDSDIEAIVKSCSQCQSNRPMPTTIQIRPWKWPSRPWSRLHLNFAGPFLGHMFLIIIDAYSKWLEVHFMNSTTFSAIITALHGVFAQFGLSSIIVTDNAQNFTIAEFESFLSQNGIKHLSSPPYHPSSNGLAERAIQSFKQSLLKLKTNSIEERVSHVLFYSRIAPCSATGLSPAELLLQNWRIRLCLDFLKPNFNARIVHQQFQQQHYANLHSKYHELKEGDPVYIRNFCPRTKWIPGHLLSLDGSVSFNVSLQGGKTVRHHIDHIRSRSEQQFCVPMSDEQTQEIPLNAPVVDPQPSVDCSSFKLSKPLTPIDPPSNPSSSSVDPPSDPSTLTEQRYPKRTHKPPDRFVPTF